MKVSIMGLAWYRPEDYSRLLQLFSDAKNLPATYEDWLKRAELGEQKFSKDGMRVVRVIVDPEEFTRWCESLGCDFDSKARIRFVNERVANIARGKNN